VAGVKAVPFPAQWPENACLQGREGGSRLRDGDGAVHLANIGWRERNIMSESSEAVFVNVIVVDPNRYEQLMEILKEGNDSVIRNRNGFISCSLLANAERTRVITVARWKSADAIKAVASDPVAAEYVRRTTAVAKATPAVFAIVAEYLP
jgi:heme-degrading monooxygenase HmoA